jgi:hypothetical protein
MDLLQWMQENVIVTVLSPINGVKTVRPVDRFAWERGGADPGNPTKY